jgi:hypothetical protein
MVVVQFGVLAVGDCLSCRRGRHGLHRGNCDSGWSMTDLLALPLGSSPLNITDGNDTRGSEFGVVGATTRSLASLAHAL